jgi:hypothetical protein
MKARTIRRDQISVENKNSLFNRLRSLLIVKHQLSAPKPQGFELGTLGYSLVENRRAELEFELRRAEGQVYVGVLPLR